MDEKKVNSELFDNALRKALIQSNLTALDAIKVLLYSFISISEIVGNNLDKINQEEVKLSQLEEKNLLIARSFVE